MKITPRSEEDFKFRNLLPPGIYNFEVFDSIEKTSKKSGDPMIELVLKIIDSNRTFKVFDYLIDREPMDFRIRQICECLGLMEKYNSGEIDSRDFFGKKGKVKINIRKDTTGLYGDKNSVQEYIVTKENKEDFLNDEVPF